MPEDHEAVPDPIQIFAHALVERFGDRAAAIVGKQVDNAAGDARTVWEQILVALADQRAD